MLTASNAPDERLSAAHRARLAYIYVRQSSVNQVRNHHESTELQYRLVDRAVRLGWPRERVHVIDEDLGKSGAGSAERAGFQKLIAEIGLGNAGLVVSLDASRLARNNRDWHQLLELCSLFGVLLADGERLYDPGAYHDRLLLGLSGIMSEAELHQIRMRLHQGERQKAARGELRLPIPAGLAHDRSGAVILNPDEEVQARLRLVFAKFRELQSARAVMRYLRANGLPLPVRPAARAGPARDCLARGRQPAGAQHPPEPGLCWGLRLRPSAPGPEPASAGVDAHRNHEGRRRPVGGVPASRPPRLHRLGGVHGQPEALGRQRQPLRSGPFRRGPPGQRAAPGDRHVRALRPPHEPALHRPERGLPGLLLPGRPRPRRRSALPGGARPARRRPGRAPSAGGPCARPDRHGDCGARAIEEEARQLDKQWALRRERARYEAERARRQYDAVEPENRLVARSLERTWEERLRAAEAIEQEYARWRRDEPLVLSQADHAALQVLGEDLPRVWHAATTTAAERKRILRFIVHEVVLDQKRAPGQVWLKILWQTGAASEHRLQRRVHTYRDYIDVERLRRRVSALNGAGQMDKEIAAALNRRASSRPAAARSRARPSGSCASAGALRRSRSTG